MITLIAAIAPNGIIGNNNDLPWKISKELSWFAQTTKNNVVIMGKNTWLSLPKRPLKDRLNIVLSNKTLECCQALYVSDINYAIRIAKICRPNAEIFVIGGSSTYKQFMDAQLIDRMLISHIKKEYSGNVIFPCLNELNSWKNDIIQEFDEFIVKQYMRN
jgi:dihydrofolate reductase